LHLQLEFVLSASIGRLTFLQLNSLAVIQATHIVREYVLHVFLHDILPRCVDNCWLSLFLLLLSSGLIRHVSF